MHWCRLRSVILAAVAASVLAACGTATGPAGAGGGGDGGNGASPAAPDVAEPARELVAHGIVMQSDPDARVELCVGPVATSYPPQCSGPGLSGEFSWDDVEAQDSAGVRWTDVTYYAVGTFDRSTDTFTLTRPLSAQPPPGLEPTTPTDVEFPQLCDDPFRGGDPAFTDDAAAQERLQQRLDTIDGLVATWVSDGVSLFNVIVTGDPEEAFTSLREVWPGGLCVEQRDLPTASEVAAAQAAVLERADDIGLLSSAGGVDGRLEVQVVVADAETTSLVHDTVAPWLTPQEVRLLSAFVPLAAK
jgi:hypothetical protein